MSVSKYKDEWKGWRRRTVVGALVVLPPHELVVHVRRQFLELLPCQPRELLPRREPRVGRLYPTHQPTIPSSFHSTLRTVCEIRSEIHAQLAIMYPRDLPRVLRLRVALVLSSVGVGLVVRYAGVGRVGW